MKRDVVGSAEGREEIVERDLISKVDHREARTPAVAVTVEQIVVSQGQVKQIARGNVWRIVVLVFRARLRDRYVFRTGMRGICLPRRGPN